MVDERGKDIRLHMPSCERPYLSDRRRQFFILLFQMVELRFRIRKMQYVHAFMVL